MDIGDIKGEGIKRDTVEDGEGDGKWTFKNINLR